MRFTLLLQARLVWTRCFVPVTVPLVTVSSVQTAKVRRPYKGHGPSPLENAVPQKYSTQPQYKPQPHTTALYTLEPSTTSSNSSLVYPEKLYCNDPSTQLSTSISNRYSYPTKNARLNHACNNLQPELLAHLQHGQCSLGTRLRQLPIRGLVCIGRWHSSRNRPSTSSRQSELPASRCWISC